MTKHLLVGESVTAMLRFDNRVRRSSTSPDRRGRRPLLRPLNSAPWCY